MRPLIAEETFDDVAPFLDALSLSDISRWGYGGHSVHFRRTRWLFRGQANDQWPLLPVALRQSTLQPLSSKPLSERKHSEQLIAEWTVLYTFLEFSDRQGLAPPGNGVAEGLDVQMGRFIEPADFEFPEPAVAPLAALAQHHGLPTRLLDWSRQPLTAAYFAAAGAATNPAPEGRLSVFALNVEPTQELLSQSGKKLLIVSPPLWSNPNLRAQDGTFTLLHDPQRTAASPAAMAPLDEEIANQPGRNPDADGLPLLRKFLLPASCAPRLLEALYFRRVDALTLFPSLDGVVRSIRERSIWTDHLLD